MRFYTEPPQCDCCKTKDPVGGVQAVELDEQMRQAGHNPPVDLCQICHDTTFGMMWLYRPGRDQARLFQYIAQVANIIRRDLAAGRGT